jgi:four helix bundle protein
VTGIYVMAFQTFEDLEVWKRGCALAVLVYESLRESKDFGLRDQMQRSAVSIPSNIAEGYERSDKDFVRFLSIAKGSAAELRTQAYIAAKVKLITTAQMKHIVDETKQLSAMMQALANSRKKDTRKKDSGSR